MSDTAITGEKPDNKSKQVFFFNEAATVVLKNWWKSLEQNKGLRASLRRTSSPTNVMFESEFYTLHKTLLGHNKAINDERFAAVMGLLAHVKYSFEGKKSFGGLLGSTDAEKGGTNPRLSEARFKRLLVIDDRDEMYRAMIRVVRLLDGKVPIADFANLVYWWNDRSKRDVAREYYKALTKFNADEDDTDASTDN
jgi:CRISPR system Cascade subunit CasB